MTLLTLNAEVKKFKAGEVVIQEGSQGEEFFWIKSGVLEVKMAQPGNKIKAVTLNNLNPGDVFGELVLLGKVRRTASVICKHDCELYAWNQKTCLTLFEKKPEVGYCIMKNLAHTLGDRLVDMNMQLRTQSEMIDNNLLSFF